MQALIYVIIRKRRSASDDCLCLKAVIARPGRLHTNRWRFFVAICRVVLVTGESELFELMLHVG